MEKHLPKYVITGTKASGKNGFFPEKHPDFPEGKKFIIVHMAASYANGSGDAFSGANANPHRALRWNFTTTVWHSRTSRK